MRTFIPLVILYLSTFPIQSFACSADDSNGHFPDKHDRYIVEPAHDSATNKPYFVTTAAVPPVFPGGDKGLFRYLEKNVQYPIEAAKDGLEGIVTVNFIINEAGEIVNAKTVGPKIGGHLELEALRVVQSMPKWRPGTNAGKPIPVEVNFPLRFSLQELQAKRKKARLYPMF